MQKQKKLLLHLTFKDKDDIIQEISKRIKLLRVYFNSRE